MYLFLVIGLFAYQKYAAISENKAEGRRRPTDLLREEQPHIDPIDLSMSIELRQIQLQDLHGDVNIREFDQDVE